jgi:hypothetical protein
MGSESWSGYAKKPTFVLSPLSAAAKTRHFTGSLFLLYLSLWTTGWRGGAWPAHNLVIDVAFVVVAVFLAWHQKRWISVALPTMFGAHAIAVSGVIPLPHTTLGWGSSALVLGFALLLAGLVVSYRLRGLTAPEPESPAR